MSNMIKWVVTDSAKYLALGVKDTNALYWLEDTREIYKGATPYTEATVLYTGELPVRGAQGKIYIESTTLKGDVWTGSAWQTVIQPVSQVVMVGGVATDKPVSGAAVKTYMEEQGAAIAAQAVTDITYDEANKAIKFIKNGAEASVALTKLGVAVAYDGGTGVLSLKDSAGTELSAVNIPLDNFVESGKYDDALDAMVLTLRSGDTVVIPAADLVQIYHADETSTVAISITNVEGENHISATVKVSATANNAIVANADGLFVDKEALLTVAAPAQQNEVLIVDAAGHSTASGVLISDLATNEYVDGIKSALETSKVSVSDIVINGAAINTVDPSQTKVISEKALVEAMSWTVLP